MLKPRRVFLQKVGLGLFGLQTMGCNALIGSSPDSSPVTVDVNKSLLFLDRKQATNEVKIPMRFDPTVDNYSKCAVLIGKDAV